MLVLVACFMSCFLAKYTQAQFNHFSILNGFVNLQIGFILHNHCSIVGEHDVREVRKSSVFIPSIQEH